MNTKRLTYAKWAALNQDLAQDLGCKKQGFGTFLTGCKCASKCAMVEEYDSIRAKEDKVLAALDSPAQEED